MTTIGGKARKPKTPTKPQFVIQRVVGLNEYALIGTDEKSNITLGLAIRTRPQNTTAKLKLFQCRCALLWYDAKFRTRHIADIPETRAFRVLPQGV